MSVIDSGAYVSEYTKKTLQQFDWAPGDPIPENMGSVLSDVHARTPESKTPGLYVDINLMTADDIALVKQTLASAKTVVAQAQQKAAVDAATAGLGESTRQLYAQLQQQQQKEEEGPPQIIDDRAASPVAAEPVIPAQPQPAPQPAEEKIETVSDGRIQPSDLLTTIADVCPRCQWDMRQKFETEVTEADKEAFIASTLGNTRFKKTYEIMGGRYVICFRSLLAEENSTIHHQLLLDQKDGNFLSDTEWMLRFFEYRLACSISEIIFDGKPFAVGIELAQVANERLPNTNDNFDATPCVRLREYMVNNVLKHEVTRRMVGKQFREFQRLYETLEAMALEPNFW